MAFPHFTSCPGEAITSDSIPAGYYLDAASIGTCFHKCSEGAIRLSLVCEALTVHEYFLSFEAERRVIWGRKFSLPTILFLINRYLLWSYALSNLLWGLVDWETDKVRFVDLYSRTETEVDCRGRFELLLSSALIDPDGSWTRQGAAWQGICSSSSWSSWCSMEEVSVLHLSHYWKLTPLSVFVALRIHIVNGRRWFWTCLVILLGCGSAPYDMVNALKIPHPPSTLV